MGRVIQHVTTLPMSPESPPILFGKLPVRADFIRRGGPSPALDALDALTQRALRSGAHARTGPLYRMVYAPPGASDVLVGAVQLSRDHVGRTYPLVTGRSLGRAGLDMRAAAAWPLRWDALLTAAAELLTAAIQEEAWMPAVEARLAALPPLLAPAGRAAEVDAHVRALGALPVQALWTQLWGSPARVGLVLRRLAEARRRPPGYGLRFPLPPSAATFGRRDAVAFWLAMSWSLLRAPSGAPSLFWTDGEPGALIVFVSAVVPAALGSLLAGEHDPDHIEAIDAGTPAQAEHAYVSLPSASRRLLEAPSTSAADFLGHLHTLG